MRVEPDCTGRCRWRQTFGSSRIARNHARRHVARVRAGEADPLQPVDVVEALEERREVARRVVRRLVVIDDLPEQLDFPRPGVRRLPRVGEDVGDRPHPLVAARVRHDAEGAELVAAFDDRDVGLQRVATARDAERKRDVLDRVEIDRGACARAAAGRRVDEHRQALQVLRTDDHVHGGRAFQNLLAFLLRDAPRDGDDRPLALLEPPSA